MKISNFAAAVSIAVVMASTVAFARLYDSMKTDNNPVMAQNETDAPPPDDAQLRLPTDVSDEDESQRTQSAAKLVGNKP